MAVEKFCGGMKNKIHAVTEWLLQGGSSKSIIDRYQRIVALRDRSDFFYVYALYGRVGRCFDMNETDAAVLLQRFFHQVQVAHIDDHGSYTCSGKHFVHQFISAAIEGIMGEDRITGFQCAE